jgi:hypothetical protein
MTEFFIYNDPIKHRRARSKNEQARALARKSFKPDYATLREEAIDIAAIGVANEALTARVVSHETQLSIDELLTAANLIRFNAGLPSIDADGNLAGNVE